jgi:hypothetical protein
MHPINCITTLLDGAQEPNRSRWKDAETFFDASIEIWKIVDGLQINFTLR